MIATHIMEVISIHALREEGDFSVALLAPDWCDFNPRPPRGGRLSCACAHVRTCVFQSTPSARRATLMTLT